MKNLLATLFVFFVGCDSARTGEDLKSGEVTQLEFSVDGKYLVVANQYRFLANSKREKCHSRLRSFAVSDWRIARETEEMNLCDFEFASAGTKPWIIHANELARFGKGNPIVGPVYYAFDPQTLERKQIDVIQQGDENQDYWPSAIACSANGSLCAVHMKRLGAGPQKPQPVFLIDLKNSKKTIELLDFPTAPHEPPGEPIVMRTLLEFTPDAKHIASCHPCKPYQLQVYATDTGKLVRSMKIDSPVCAMKFSPDGKFLAGLCLNGDVLILEPDFSKQMQKLKVGSADQLSPYATAFVGEKYLAVLSGWNQIELFSTSEWKSVRTFKVEKNQINCLASSPDGNQLAVGLGRTGRSPGLVRIWDVVSGKLVKELK